MSSENSQQQSPLAQIRFSQQGLAETELRIQELPFRGLVNLRGSLDNPAFVAAAEEVLGASLMMENNHFIETDKYTILWYGPQEWLLVTEPAKEAELVADLRARLSDTFSAVSDVTGGNTIIEISGNFARDLLSCGSMIDFHENEFLPGQCVQTLFAKTNVAIYHCQAKNVFRMIVRRSFADYLGVWLADTARSFANTE